ncbi:MULTISPECIES: ABC transporter ATP-binding protein [unclassified Bradyrhizobium]|uniref:ABC transporter ATP-binding protein n=1 Tax=unclassified Bradyrhizobium TaxID=2631580 RepID=UPI0020B370AA|nr:MULTISPECIES: ATP-binding cassette domain-containing protein [unclassified Bradyrhizobium]MCP3379894.1 ABC transporter ATP-binding protein [Bradyrhizobium sp. CCGUVB4N]MCP3440727.1 ABC transporter ATP-binding protein [Bradyrhizobium sp. CCGUVB14]
MNATANSEAVRLRVDRVSKQYGDMTALAATDLVIRKGEFVSLLGPSGSGKTTLLNIVAGAAMPSTGRVLLDGRDITHLPSRERNLGMVFQHYALIPHMTVFDNVAFPLKVRGVAKNEIADRVRAVLATVRLDQLTDRKPSQLSGGQQQRVSIARCLVYDPPVILMDEPLGALDKGLREAMQFEIKRLHRQLGITALYVTHDQDEAMALSDRICVMNNGSIAQLSAARELYYQPTSKFVAEFLGESNVLPGKVTSSGSTIEVELDEGAGSVRSTQPCTLKPGEQAFAMMRPESISIVATPGQTAADNKLACTVEGVEFIGGVSRVRLRAAGNIALSVKLLSSHKPLATLASGDHVWATWSPSDTILLDRTHDA